jgi:ATP-dependent DNA helicase RecQ
MPKNLEGYYQDTGRAGRDGLPAHAWMAYGLSDVVNQRRMIDEGGAEEEFKAVLRSKLDALLSLAEATDCRRVRLLQYFGETSSPCGNCDNCLHPPTVWDGTDAARKLLSTIYRVHEMSALTFGAGHIMDVLRGKDTDKVRQFLHDKVSTFGIGKGYSETQLRGVMRQLLATGALGLHKVTSENSGHVFDTLCLTSGSRDVLRGEVQVQLRETVAAARSRSTKRGVQPNAAAANLGPDAQARFINLKAWRSEVAKSHNLPAYVIFQDATLAAIAEQCPGSLQALGSISGIGSKKLDAYGAEVLRVIGGPSV